MFNNELTYKYVQCNLLVCNVKMLGQSYLNSVSQYTFVHISFAEISYTEQKVPTSTNY